MRVDLNALSLRSGGSGVQTYARELLRAFAEQPRNCEMRAVVAQADANEVPRGLATRTVRVPFDHGLTRKIMSAAFVRSPADVVHGLDTDAPLAGRAARVVTVHDLALFDAPWAFSPMLRFGKRQLVAQSIRRADHVIAVSDFTAQRVQDLFQRTSTVIHEAPAASFFVPDDRDVHAVQQKWALPERFVLYAGNLEPRKDVPTLAAACREAGVPLVVTGGAMQHVELPDTVRSIGYVTTDELRALYRVASVVAYVATYEGFGLPPVEAMASGGCVLATRVGALPEIASEGIEFVERGSVVSQAAAIRLLISDTERNDHRRRYGVTETQRLSWHTAAQAHIDCYINVVR